MSRHGIADDAAIRQKSRVGPCCVESATAKASIRIMLTESFISVYKGFAIFEDILIDTCI